MRRPNGDEQQARNEEGSSGHQPRIIPQRGQKYCEPSAIGYGEDGGFAPAVARLSSTSLTSGFSRTPAKAGSVFALATSL